MADSEIPVTAETPDSALHTTGTDHITLIGSNEEDTVAFYRDVLGMPLVLRQPNLDAPDVTHLFFDTGDGRVLTFFVNEDRDSNPAPQRTGVGAVHHLAFSIEAGELENIKTALNEEGHGFSEFDRGAFHSLYTRDHNGLTIELVVDKYAIPDDRRGEVLALSQSKRVAAGADYVDDEHMQAALEELDLPVERAEVPDAATGTGYDN
ncbi:VOC family protein [Halorarum halophilum]|uniref:VOC family protein n=1 Tax=Halorarum halophilum TaxID=2743090 RepID=A0A7D5K1L0_9EURY|nr:VOC family protein [Halobaculum halophilum]QLG27981.1 VOC family protein [Halobaculum halophilum]